MVINPLKTTNKAARIVLLAVLLKLFSYELNIKKTQSQQQFINSLLSTHDKSKSIIANTKNLLANSQQEIPTKVWIRDENELVGVLQRKCVIKLEQCERQNVEYDYSLKTIFSSKPLKYNFEAEIIDTFVQRINCPTPLHIELINNASKLDRERTIVIISSFPISKQKSNYLISAIRGRIADSAKIKFQIRKSITNKIELCDLGYRISWNLKHYITDLNIDTSEVLA